MSHRVWFSNPRNGFDVNEVRRYGTLLYIIISHPEHNYGRLIESIRVWQNYSRTCVYNGLLFVGRQSVVFGRTTTACTAIYSLPILLCTTKLVAWNHITSYVPKFDSCVISSAILQVKLVTLLCVVSQDHRPDVKEVI